MAWVKLDDHIDEHDKVLALEGDAPDAMWLLTRALLLCGRKETDGHVPTAALGRIGSDWTPARRRRLVGRLVEVGFLHDPGHGCERCPQPDGGWQVHDYPDYQPTRAKLEADRQQRREAGRRGGLAKGKRAAKRTASEPSSEQEADEVAEPKPVPGPVPRPVEPQGQEPSRPTSDDAGPDVRRSWAEKAADFPDQVHTLTRQFATGVKANGAKIPKPDTKAQHDWLQAFDRLLRKGAPGGDDDPTDPDEVARVIGWVLADEFERTVVLSPGKFRERYPQLRLKALAPPRRNGSGGRAPVAPAPADADWRAGWSGQEATA